MDQHSLPVDVSGLERGDFADPQPGTVCEHEQRAVLRRLGGVQKSPDLRPAQDLRRAALHLRERDAVGRIATKHRAESAADRCEVGVARARVVLVVRQIDEVLLDILAGDLAEGFLGVFDEPSSVPGVYRRRYRGERPQEHPLLHLLHTLLDVVVAYHRPPP
jgi:hypothetical protein